MKFHHLAKMYGMKLLPPSRRAMMQARNNLDMFHQRVLQRRQMFHELQASGLIGSGPSKEDLAQQLFDLFQNQQYPQLNVVLAKLSQQEMDQLSLAWMTLRRSTSSQLQ